MAFDLGDPIPLVFTTKDASGALANVTTATLTITLPDASTTTPAVTSTGTGLYAPTTPYICTQAGIHRVSWVGSGTNAQDYTDTFNVLPADPGFIISLAEARRGLRLSDQNTVKDDDLRTYIAAATPIMEDLVGPILRTTRVETYDGGSTQIVLLNAPLVSVSLIIESFSASYQRTLTPQDIFTGSGADAFGYTVELSTGTVTRRSTGIPVPFAQGRRNIQVTYVSGRAAVTGNLLLATRRLVGHLWSQEQQSYRPDPRIPVEPMATTPLGFAVPRAVIEMCAGSLRPPGLA